MSAARYLSEHEFKGYKPAQEEGRAASNWLTTDEGHDWFEQRMIANDATHGVSTPSGLFSFKDDTSDTMARASWPEPKSAWNLEENRWQDY